MDDLAYLAVVIFGGLTLIVEATRQFAIPTKLDSHENFPTLRGLELASLSTRNEYIRGYVFYVFFYLVAYAAFLGSTELFELLEAAAGRIDTTGPTGSFEGADGSLSLDSGKYAKPLFISTTIIFALSIGVISRFEYWVRTFAHRLAGIPRGVYRVITQVNKIDYDNLGKLGKLPNLTRFNEAAATLTQVERESRSYVELRQDLKILDVVSPSLIGELSERFWPQDSLNMFSALVKQQREVDAKIGKGIEDLREGKTTASELVEVVHDGKNGALALFSLLYIRNRNIGLPNLQNPTSRIIIELRREKSNPVTQSVFGATLFSFFLSIIVYILIEVAYYYVFIDSEDAGLAETIGREISNIARSAIWFALKFTALFAIAAFLAAAVRESHAEMGAWSPWVARVTPYQKLVYSSLFPAVLATAAFALVSFLEYAVMPYLTSGVIITGRHIIEFGRSYLPFILLAAMLPFFASLCVYIVANVHVKLRWYRTTLIGVLFSFACFVWVAIAIVITYGIAPNEAGAESLMFSLKEASVYFVSALVFFASFAVLLELTEGRTRSVA
ncbi:MAG: hypothetical protein ACRED5_15540 [Propylenella sp.]